MFLSVFVNGACSGNPSVGAWGFILQRQEQTLLEYFGVAQEEKTTSHRMELVAVIEGVKSASIAAPTFPFASSVNRDI